MSGPLSDTLGYSSLSLTSFPNIPGSTQQLLRFGITGASYTPSNPASTYNINIPGGGRGDILFLRNTDNGTFDPINGLGGSTTFDIRINTNSSGDGGVTFNVLKGSNTNYGLYYAPNSNLYANGDVTNIIPVSILLGPQPGGEFTVNPVVSFQNATNFYIETNGAKYDGYDIPNSKTALPNMAALTVYQQTSGETGLRSGPLANIVGITLNGMAYSGNGTFYILTNVGLANPLTWDMQLSDSNKLYLVYSNSFNIGVPPAELASNYIAIGPINRPLTNSPTTFTSSSAGITANIFNINYNFAGLTAGQILVTNAQAGTTGISNIIQNPITNTYYAPYFFSPVSGTPIVEPGSYYQYINPANPSQLSGATFSIPSRVLVPEGITGTLSVSAYNSRASTIVTLNNFDYTNSDQSSIFTDLGHTGQIYLTNQYTGSTGVLFVFGTTVDGIIRYTSRGPYDIQFPELGPTGATSIPFKLSVYDGSIQSLKASNITIPVAFPALTTVPESLIATENEKVVNSSSIYLKFNAFDYLDEYSYSIFGPSGITGGTISLLNGSTTGPVIGSTAYNYSLGSNYNYVISATGTFSSTATTDTYLRFTPNGSSNYRTANKRIFFSPSPPSESFIGDFTLFQSTSNSLSFTLRNFDYLDFRGESVFNGPSYVSNPRVGRIELSGPTGTVLQSITFTGSPTNQSFQFSINAPGPFRDYFLSFYDTTINFRRSSIKKTMATGITPYSDPNVQGGTAFGYTGAAELQFPYIFTANAAEVTEITVLGELTKPLNFDQKIVLNVPSSELQRMLVYDSAWVGGQYGTGASGGDGFSGLSGSTHQTASGFTGPNIGLFLKYVLSQVNVLIPGGFTGHNGVSGQSDRLGGLDILFSDPIIRNYQTLGNSGQTGNPWGATAGLTGYFADDAGITGPQISKYMADNNISGVGATFSSQSLLNFIPVEAIRSITQSGLQIDKVSNVVRNVDTTMPIYVDPLRNLFEQSVAYSRVTDSNIYPVSIVPSGLTGSNSPWTTAAKIYGVDFNDGDSLTFYIRYAMGAVRRYGIDPTLVGGLDPIWQNAPSITLTFNGKSFDIPIGSSSTYSGLTGGGTTGGSDADTELSTGGQLRTLAVQLLASPNKSNFDY